MKILHFDEGLWLYYHRLERSHFRWASTPEKALKIDIEELRWLLKGYETRTESKFKFLVKLIIFPSVEKSNIHTT